MHFNIELNKTIFHVGIVKNTIHEFKVKIGLTKELCDVSKTLSFEKHPPFAFNCDYKSLAYFKEKILTVLGENGWQNFGVAEQPDNVIHYITHRFNYNAPTIPLTRL